MSAEFFSEITISNILENAELQCNMQLNEFPEKLPISPENSEFSDHENEKTDHDVIHIPNGL